jgi:glycosyltransferase involved in cell wall biosynthesis
MTEYAADTGTPKAAPTVLHLIDTGGPGGAETLFATLAQRLGAPARRSLAIVPREDWLSGRLRTLGITPVVLPAKGSLHLSYLKTLIRTIRRDRVRLIHTHLLGSAVYGALAGLITRTPVLAVLHGPTDLRQLGRLAGLKRWLLKHGCAAVVAVSTSTQEALEGLGIGARSVTLIRNGVDTERFSPGRATELRTELGLSDTQLLIGAVGNIRAPKAYDILLNAAALVLKRVPDCHFAIVGEGSPGAMQPLQELRASLGIQDRCHLLGFRDGSPALYRNFDVFVSSSRSEGLSLAFLEAMATGLPIIATRSGGPQEVLTSGENGVLVPVEDAPALAAALCELLSNPGERAALGARARDCVVNDFSQEAMIRRYEDLYARLLPQPTSVVR